MGSFKKFYNEDDYVQKTLKNLPKKYQELLKGYKFLFEPKSTLYGDKDHVGMISNHPEKKVNISASWSTSREFILLHELAHLIFESYVKGTKFEKEWKEIVKNTKDKKKESDDENFCHGFANFYAKYKMVIHTHDTWTKFFEKLEKAIN
jgi:predicted metal-dependent hydrolase